MPDKETKGLFGPTSSSIQCFALAHKIASKIME